MRAMSVSKVKPHPALAPPPCVELELTAIRLKCNRSSPCENCVRRNDVPGCTYATSTHSARQRKQSAGSNGSSDEMQSRIDRLEGLVLSLMSGNSNNINTSPRNRDTRSSSSGAAASYPNSRDSEGDDDAMGYDEQDEHEETHTVEEEVEEVRNALGVMKVQEGKSFYRGETHWVAILSEVRQHSTARLFSLSSRLITSDRLPRLKNTSKKPNKSTRVSLPRCDVRRL